MDQEIKLQLNIPDPVLYILKKLRAAGFEAFIVGGCVRDALLGRQPNDWDITTSALPLQVKEVFRRTIDTGIKHGTVTVLLHEGQFEVTTYRIDGLYEDSRHPKEVTFTSNLEEDLRRRDFTINAMAYHPEVGIVDPYNGMDDLEEGVIRAVGCPEERFEEDALRIMRAVRFSAQLGFALEPETFLGLKKFAPRLALISKERVRDELLKLICSPYPETFRLLYETGITAVIFPRFDEMMKCPQNCESHVMNVGDHTLATLEGVPATVTLRLAALLHDTGKVESKKKTEDGKDSFPGHNITGKKFAENWMREMRLDNATISQVCTLIENHDFLYPKNEAGVRQAMNKVGPLFDDLMTLMKGDINAKSPSARERGLKFIAEIERLHREIAERGDCTSLRQLKINGGDLIKMGIKPGPDMGRILEALLNEVLENPEKNNFEYLSERAAEIR